MNARLVMKDSALSLMIAVAKVFCRFRYLLR